MPVMTDISIRRWSTTAADNSPSDGEFIGRNFARQWRNIKSIERGESLDKEFEKTAYVSASSASAGSGAGTITVAGEGNLSTTFTTLRKLRLTPTAGGDAIYVAVDSVTYNGGTDINTVVLIELTDTIGTNVEYAIDLGVVNPDASCLPAVHESGQITISEASTSGTATFAAAGLRTDDLCYFAKTTVVSADGGASSDVVTRVVKAAGSMEIHIKAAPGAGNSTVIDWQVFRGMP